MNFPAASYGVSKRKAKPGSKLYRMRDFVPLVHILAHLYRIEIKAVARSLEIK